MPLTDGTPTNREWVLEKLGDGYLHVEDIQRETGLTHEEVCKVLTLLEMDGKVRRHPGDMYTKTGTSNSSK